MSSPKDRLTSRTSWLTRSLKHNPPTEAIRRIIAYTVKSIELYQREIGLFFEQWRREEAEDRLPGTKQKRDEYESVVVRIVEKEIPSGELSRLEDPRIIAFAIFGSPRTRRTGGVRTIQ